MRRSLKRWLLFVLLFVVAGSMIAANVCAAATDAEATVTYGVVGVEGWGSQSATFTAPEGWLLSFDKTGFGSELTRVTSYEGSCTYYLLKNGEETPIEKSVELKLDMGKPIISSAVASNVTDASATVKVTATDALSGVYRYELAGDSISPSASNNHGEFSLSGLSPNTLYEYTITVYDKAGNSNSTVCSFTTSKTDISGAVVSVGGKYIYSGVAQVPSADAVTVKLNGKRSAPISMNLWRRIISTRERQP